MGALVVQPATRVHGNFVSGQNIHLVIEGRLRRNRIVVSVAESTDKELVLNVQEAEQEMLELEVGNTVELGYGFRIARMHFVCPARIVAIEGSKVILTPPGEAKKQPRRGFARVAYEWPVVMTLKDGSVHTGRTTNVSASGALVRLEDPEDLNPNLEDVHKIVLTGADDREYATEFKVVRSIRERNRMSLAIHYDGLPEVERVHLELQVLRGIARRFLRVGVPLRCKVELSSPGGRLAFEGTTENVSGGGVMLHCDGFYPLMPKMTGTLTFDLDGEPLELTEVVVLRVLETDGEGSRLIIEFPQIQYATRVTLVEFLMKKLGESRNV